jgi:pyridoxal phosphate enzyme (YggS family)
MSVVFKNIQKIESQLNEACKLVAVSKRQPNSKILEAYADGFKRFGENYVQEIVSKSQELPKDIEWHMIGHLQRNKVKFIAPFIELIHSVDSIKLLKEINKEALKNERVINCLLQVHIAEEENKNGFDKSGLLEALGSDLSQFRNVSIIGLMGMSTFTDNMETVKAEFESLKLIFDHVQQTYPILPLKELSMGMSGDWRVAMDHGSTLIRVGSSVFGERL